MGHSCRVDKHIQTFSGRKNVSFSEHFAYVLYGSPLSQCLISIATGIVTLETGLSG